MRAITFVTAFLAPQALVGCVLLGDRALGVDGEIVSEAGSPIDRCVLGLHMKKSDRLIATKSDLDSAFVRTFTNPPLYGDYYISVTCPGRSGSFKSGSYDFARPPFLHQLGKVVIAQ
jgi:hypothetical protein